MKAMIFAAGMGTRLKPLTDRMPKALVPLAGKPLLQWQIEKLREAGITDIVVNVHHFPDMIIDAVRQADGWGCRVQISDERDGLLDTGGGLRKARTMLGNEPFLACNVDILSTIDVRALIAAHDPRTMGTLVVSDRQTQRYLLFDDEQTLRGWTNIATGEVKPQSAMGNQLSAMRKLAFSGMQILSPRIFDRMDGVVAAKGEKFSLIDLYLSICQDEVLKGYVPQNYRMMDVGKIDQIEEAERFAESL
ncbi:MAG: nucleotidyltransferase family protein [Paludibacteraceae bacterium]|nr:nucleotidyltransferase family protein [Paludibacteraceae bacterium]